jgi:hypothetical protein
MCAKIGKMFQEIANHYGYSSPENHFGESIIAFRETGQNLNANEN